MKFFFSALLLVLWFVGCSSSQKHQPGSDTAGSTTPIIDDVGADLDVSSNGSDVVGATDTADDSTEGCVPPPQYYEGKRYRCVGISDTLMLMRTDNGWNIGRAPYGDVIAFEGLRCDPTDDLVFAKCVSFDQPDTECVRPPQYYSGKELKCTDVSGTQMLSLTNDGWDIVDANPYGDKHVVYYSLTCDPTEMLALIGCVCKN